MSAAEIAFASALDLVELYRGKTLSPVEVAQALFTRLDRLQASLNAFCVINREGALEAARASEQRWMAGEPLSTLLVDRLYALGTVKKVYDLYGPSETSIIVTSWKCKRGKRQRSVPIGRPLPNTEVYVLDAERVVHSR